MNSKFDYAIETLNIEKYKMLALHRQLQINEHDCQTSFAKQTEKVRRRIKQLEDAIKILK